MIVKRANLKNRMKANNIPKTKGQGSLDAKYLTRITGRELNYTLFQLWMYHSASCVAHDGD